MSEPTFETKGHRLGFLELFQTYSHVEIPLIQRDYAQGRKSAKAIRGRFLDNLLDALKKNDNDNWLSLDFVYGEVVKAENNQNCFQPIDGQQRLTTLFLVHWYLACVAGQREDFAKRMQDEGKKPRFRYSVRKSSNQFFAEILGFNPDLTQALVEQLRDQAWFFRAWHYDSTIEGALEMLKEIQEKFIGEEAKTFYDTLKQPNSPITLDVLNLGDVGLSDEIYIKMNARGKELTGFEKFKAWLVGNYGETNRFIWPDGANETKQWPILLDGDWLDLFWSFRNPTDPNPSESVSKAYFRTFVALAVNFHASENEFAKEWMTADCDDQRSLWDSIFTKLALQYVFQNLWNLSLVNKEWLDNLRFTLENQGIPFLKESANSKDCLWNAFFEGDTEPGLNERLWLHALCLFLDSPGNGAPRSDTLRDDWFRVIRNLIENSTFSQETFANAIQGISTLAQKCLSPLGSGKNRPVLSALADLSFGEKLKGFDGHQNDEESNKARRMLEVKDGSEWEKMIIEAENHPVFRGQIGFLLEEAKTLDLFQKRWAVVNGLLNVKGSKFGQDKYLLARAALSQCEPIIVEWQQNLEFKDTARHWKVLLGSVALECDGQLTPKGKFRKGMKKLVNHLIASRDYENDMTKLCQQASVDKDWMDEVIRYGHIFLQWGPALWISREQKVQNYQNNGTFIYFQTNSSESDIMLGKQANWRNSIIKLLLESEIGLSIDDSRKVLQMDAVPPFYKGHQFFTKQESQPWRVWIQYRKIVLQRKNMVSSQSSDTEKWTNVSECIFEFQENAAEQPEIIVERIKEKVKSWQPQIDLQP